MFPPPALPPPGNDVTPEPLLYNRPTDNRAVFAGFGWGAVRIGAEALDVFTVRTLAPVVAERTDDADGVALVPGARIVAAAYAEPANPTTPHKVQNAYKRLVNLFIRI